MACILRCFGCCQSDAAAGEEAAAKAAARREAEERKESEADASKGTLKTKELFDRFVQEGRFAVIRTLELRECVLLRENFVSIRKCEKLEELDLRNISFDGEELRELPAALTKITIRDNGKLKKDVVEGWLKKNPPLEHLDLQQTPLLKTERYGLVEIFREAHKDHPGKEHIEFFLSVDETGMEGVRNDMSKDIGYGQADDLMVFA